MDHSKCEALLLRCKDKDAKAFEQLYALTSSKLYGVLYQLFKQDTLAEDVLQDAYLKIWNNAGSYHASKGKAITWMMTIARNKGIDKLRSLQVRPDSYEDRIDSMDTMISNAMDPDQLTNLDQDVSQLNDCLKLLSEDQRQCMMLSFYQGYTHSELSNQLNKPLGTIKAWLRRGLDKVRECMS